MILKKDRTGYLKINRDGLTPEDKLLMYRNYTDDITDSQAEMMLHALGADNRKYRTYDKSKYYHAYRNYYDAGGTDVDSWEDLVSKGYAEKQSCYHVTVKGIRILEYLTQCRIWDDYENVADCRNCVLFELMKDDVFCGYGCWLPTSSKDLSLRLAIPQKLILETLRSLAEEGLAKKGYYGDMDEDGCVHCTHGWYLTEHARERYVSIYKTLKEEEYRNINDSLKSEGE